MNGGTVLDAALWGGCVAFGYLLLLNLISDQDPGKVIAIGAWTFIVVCSGTLIVIEEKRGKR